jgi:ribose 5-phosphate isomerase B
MIFIGADHAGFALKEEVKRWLNEWGEAFEDVGALELDPNDDYPDYAFAVAERVAASPHTNRGILACGSGQGMCVASNKVHDVRAVMLDDAEQARLAREHGNTNVLCLSSWRADPEELREVLRTWLATPFSNEERHARRLRKIAEYEETHWKE